MAVPDSGRGLPYDICTVGYASTGQGVRSCRCRPYGVCTIRYDSSGQCVWSGRAYLVESDAPQGVLVPLRPPYAGSVPHTQHTLAQYRTQTIP